MARTLADPARHASTTVDPCDRAPRPMPPLAGGHAATAVSTAYYAMLYAARAALSERDRHARSHAGTWGLFREEFALTRESASRRWSIREADIRAAERACAGSAGGRGVPGPALRPEPVPRAAC